MGEIKKEEKKEKSVKFVINLKEIRIKSFQNYNSKLVVKIMFRFENAFRISLIIFVLIIIDM